MVHDRVDAREEQRVDRADSAGVRPERGDRYGGGSELLLDQDLRKHRLCADLPVEVEGVSETKRVRLLQWELTEEQVAVAIGRHRVTTAGHHVSGPVHLTPLDQEIGIHAGPRSGTAVE